jgi:hypothetical protein
MALQKENGEGGEAADDDKKGEVSTSAETGETGAMDIHIAGQEVEAEERRQGIAGSQPRGSLEDPAEDPLEEEKEDEGELHLTTRGLCDIGIENWREEVECEVGLDEPVVAFAKHEQRLEGSRREGALNGIEDSEITVNPPTVNDLESNQWSENRRNFRYIINTTLTVSTKKVDLVNTAIFRQAELLKQGVAIEGSNPQYEYVSFQQMKPEMMEEAIKNAQKTAEQFANASDAKLGAIQTAGQGQFGIDDRDQNTPYIKKLRVVTTITYGLDD